MAKRESKANKVSDIILEQIIGKRPRKPQTYDMRKRLGTEADLEFCKNYDDRLAEWERKAEKERQRVMKERAKEKENEKKIVAPEKPTINATVEAVVSDFLMHYKRLNKKDFQKVNPYSNTKEPNQYLYTLIFYFLKDERFFKSPLLRKDLSTPSFDKGTLSIGWYGCGKTTTFDSLLTTFRTHVEYVKTIDPKNLKDILTRLDINSCISSEVVLKYNTTTDIQSVLRPLLSYKQLYIDDILREEDANNYGKLNIFKQVLTHRADRGYKTHITMNYLEEFESKINDSGKEILIPKMETLKSLDQFRTRYDGRVHDRLFGMYNIIELTGKSFRR